MDLTLKLKFFNVGTSGFYVEYETKNIYIKLKDIHKIVIFRLSRRFVKSRNITIL